MGNGRLGGMVYGGIGFELIQLNEETLRDGGPIDRNNHRALQHLPQLRRLLFEERSDEAAALIASKMLGIPPRAGDDQTLGNLWLDFPGMGQPTHYHRELDLETGIVTVRYRIDGVAYTREVFASVPDQVLVIHMRSSQPKAINCEIRLGRPDEAHPEEASVAGWAESPNRLVLRGSRLKFFAQLAVRCPGGSCGPSGQKGSFFHQSNQLSVEDADEMTIVLAAATGWKGPTDQSGQPDLICEERLTRVHDKSYAALRADHVDDHRRLFGRVSIDLGPTAASQLPTDERLATWRQGGDGPDLAALYFQFGRYLMMASSRPGTLPSHLQGIWNENLRPIWHSGYWLNMNEEMNYWPAEVANLDECHTALFDLMERLVEPGCKTARIHYGARRGWVVHLMTDVWGFTEPGYGPHGHWPMSAAWLCRHPWEHYLYGGDKAFLAQRAFPLMKGVAQFLLDFLVEAPQGSPVAGKLVTNPSQSPENEFLMPNGSRGYLSCGSTVDLMIVRELFTNCLQAIDILGLKEDLFREELASSLQKLAPYQISQRTGRLQEWVEDYEEAEPGHRHMSPFYALHPSDQITPEKNPKLAAAIRKSVERRRARWLEQCMAHQSVGTLGRGRKGL